jgi:ubiquitin carboxyl-terminal hydrolase L5
MLEKLGCHTVELDELYSLDDDSLERLKETGKVHGLIFLFKWMGDKQREHAAAKEPLADAPDNLFFAHQVTTNACATQAILSVVFNADLSPEDMGSTLAEFKSFTAEFPPNLKGVAISSSEEIRNAHNAFSRQDAFLQEGSKYHIPTEEKDEAFHFVAYVPQNDVVYELDGLQPGPIVVGSYGESSDWLSTARAAIQERMEAGGDHIKFNLMAVIQDKRVVLKERLQGLASDSSEYSDLVASLAAENAKREQWKIENQRRCHNYVPLCVQILKELARMGSLPQLVTEAKERQSAKLAKKSSALK